MSRVRRELPIRIVGPGLGLFYRATFNTRISLRVARRVLELGSAVSPLPAGTVVRDVVLGGVAAERTTVGATERPRAVLYLHGGGYTVCSPATHRGAAAHLAREAGAVVWNLDYRLAPEHPYPAALEDGLAAYLALVADGWDPARLALAGDSAGGGLAVAVARRLIDDHGVRPAALALFSPYTDASDTDALAPRDLVVSVAWGTRNAADYSAGADLTTPGISPMFSPLGDLPPLWIQTGVTELLYRQILRFAAKATGEGADVTLVEHPTLWHSGHTQAGVVREATELVAEAGGWLRKHLSE